MKVMTIKWQRLTDESGETCDRCGSTEAAVQDATVRLKKVLAPFRVEVRLVASTLDPDTFKSAPQESNRVWIADEPLESLLEAKVGMSPCVDCGDLCGDEAVCRTMTVSGKTYEAVPADLIVQAGLVAASRSIRDERPGLGLTYCVE